MIQDWQHMGNCLRRCDGYIKVHYIVSPTFEYLKMCTIGSKEKADNERPKGKQQAYKNTHKLPANN